MSAGTGRHTVYIRRTVVGCPLTSVTIVENIVVCIPLLELLVLVLVALNDVGGGEDILDAEELAEELAELSVKLALDDAVEDSEEVGVIEGLDDATVLEVEVGDTTEDTEVWEETDVELSVELSVCDCVSDPV